MKKFEAAQMKNSKVNNYATYGGAQKGFNPALFFEQSMNRMRNQQARAEPQVVMNSTQEDATEVLGKPTVTPLDDKELTINEEHMEEVISKGVEVFNDGPPNGMPDPEKDPKDDDEDLSSNKAKM